MIKRILVALDIDSDTPVATRYAGSIASRFEADVTGIAMVDTHKIASEVGGGGAIGAMYYAEQVRTRYIKLARERAKNITDAFDQALNLSNVSHDRSIKEGIPFKHIIDGMKYHDLLVIGHRSHFLYSHPEKETNTLAKVVKKSVSPTLVVTDEYRDISRVLIAYDGSEASARTLQRFTQLQPFGTDIELHLVFVRSLSARQEPPEAELLLNKAEEFLRAHGFDAVLKSNIDGASPLPAILEHAALVQADLIVAGAHSVSALRRIAFGSTTAGLLERCSLPLFLFH